MVYKNLLILDEPIELWAEPNDTPKDQRRHLVNATVLREPFLRGGDVKLEFLCTCKQISFEASEIFYGDNDFRFSGTD